MGKKSIMLIIASILIVLSASFLIPNALSHPIVALNTHNYVPPFGAAQGQLKYELTFENVINKYSSNVVVCKVISGEKYSKNKNMYKVEINENLVGEVEGSTIFIHADKDSLIMGKSYLLSLREHDSALQNNVFYVALNQFIIQIDENSNLLLLENSETQEFIKPFKTDKFNNLDNAKAYINEIKKDNMYINNTKKKVIDQAKDVEELIKLSNHIIEISVIDYQISGEVNNIAIVDYDCYKKYKGGNFKNIHSLLLPTNIEKDKKYLLFLVGDNDEVTLATRKGSVLEVGSNEYNNAIKYINN